LVTKEKIEALVRDHLKDGPVYLTGIKVSSDQHISVYIDGDEGVAIKDCVALSRAIESVLDQTGEHFSLDVSSHGATTPLVTPRQYKKHIGRTLEIRLNDNSKAEGELTQADDKGFGIRFEVRENKPVGKGKITVEKQQEFLYTEVKEVKVKLKY
jgi:ribosome maturation factor RimP